MLGLCDRRKGSEEKGEANACNEEGVSTAANRNSRRFAILAISSAVIFTAYVMQYQASALAFRLVSEFGIDSVSLARLMFAPLLFAAVVGIPLGALADRFGTRRVVGFALLASCVAAIARIGVGSFPQLLACTVALGLAPAAMNANLMRLLGSWFGEKTSVAIGVYYACSGMGAAVSMLSAALLPTTRAAFALSAAALAACALLWWGVVADAPQGVSRRNANAECGDGEASTAAHCFVRALRSPGMWLVAFVTSVCLASKTAFLSYTPQALLQFATPELANSYAAAITAGGIVGCLVGPSLCLRMRHKRAMLLVCVALTTWLMGLSAFMLQTPSFAVFVLIGALSSVTAPMVEAVPCALPELAGCVGSAGGIIGSVSLAASYVVPLGIVMMAGTNYVVLLCLIAVCFALSIPAMAVMPGLEPGKKER